MSDRPYICCHGCLRRQCETCDLADDVERLERERGLMQAQLLALASVLAGDDKGETPDHARWTPALDVARKIIADLADARAEVERLRKDAERYRWLRDSRGGAEVACLFRREWDAAIDAALSAQEPPKP